MQVSTIGAIGYWILAWVLLSFLFSSETLGLETLLTANYGNTWAIALTLISIAVVGMIVGSISGLILGMLQWFVLRPYNLFAGWWLTSTILVSGVTIAVFLSALAWISRGSGWL